MASAAAAAGRGARHFDILLLRLLLLWKLGPISFRTLGVSLNQVGEWVKQTVQTILHFFEYNERLFNRSRLFAFSVILKYLAHDSKF
jgi:hypothetical protein